MRLRTRPAYIYIYGENNEDGCSSVESMHFSRDNVLHVLMCSISDFKGVGTRGGLPHFGSYNELWKM